MFQTFYSEGQTQLKNRHSSTADKWRNCWNQHHTFSSGKYVNAVEDIKFYKIDNDYGKGKYTQSYFIRKFQKWQKVIETKMKIKKKVIDI